MGLTAVNSGPVNRSTEPLFWTENTEMSELKVELTEIVWLINSC